MPIARSPSSSASAISSEPQPAGVALLTFRDFSVVYDRGQSFASADELLASIEESLAVDFRTEAEKYFSEDDRSQRPASAARLGIQIVGAIRQLIAENVKSFDAASPPRISTP